MTKNHKTILSIAGFILLIVTAVFSYNALSGQLAPVPSDSSGEYADKEKASDFTMLDQDGNSFKLSEMEGKPIVLNFWASWCPPCKIEMPDFENVYQELGDEIQFMMINMTDGQRETVNNANKFISAEGYTFPVYFDTMHEGMSAYGIRSIPTTFFIDKDGYIATSYIGLIDELTLRQGIDMIK